MPTEANATGLVRWAGVGSALDEERGADADARRAFFDSQRKVAAHAHRDLREVRRAAIPIVRGVTGLRALGHALIEQVAWDGGEATAAEERLASALRLAHELHFF